jgi:hypothetical protein
VIAGITKLKQREGERIMENKTKRINFEKWWCEEEVKWIKQGGNSEYSLDYLNGFLDGITFNEKENK